MNLTDLPQRFRRQRIPPRIASCPVDRGGGDPKRQYRGRGPPAPGQRKNDKRPHASGTMDETEQLNSVTKLTHLLKSAGGAAMAEECRRHSKRELLLALAERLDQVLWCLLTATDPGCNEKARNRATLEAQKFAQEADGL